MKAGTKFLLFVLENNSFFMTIEEYKIEAKDKRFEEHPYTIYGGQTELKHFVEYNEATVDLKIHMAKIILCRNFSPAGGYCVLSDQNWYINQFLKNFESDLARPWLTGTIKESMQMIVSEDVFKKQIIGTTFMFGIIEFYAKYLLGWRPIESDFFDKKAHSSFREMTLSDAIGKLKKSNTELASILIYIDNQSVNRLKEVMVEENRWVIPRIADRLRVARNPMLHGENHSFSSIGEYLCMLYILFHLHDMKKMGLEIFAKKTNNFAAQNIIN
jgi:hypothetical protein